MEPYILLCNNCGRCFGSQAPSTLPLDTTAYLRHEKQIDEKETQLYSKIIIDLPKKISEYDTEISRLNTTLEQLKTSRHSLVTCMDKFKSLLSPVCRLPRDVLQDIFEFVCTSISYDAFLSRNDLPLVSIMPFYLSSVCAYWRNICLSSPPIWTSISASIDCRGASMNFPYVAKLFKQRSHARLLNFQMSMEIEEIAKGLNHYDVKRRLHYAVDSLLYSPNALNLQQVKRIGINSRTVRLWDILRKDIHPEFPELEYFEFSGDVEFSGDHLVKLFEYAPKLHSVALNAVRGTSFSLPSKQITTIHFGNTFSLVYPSRFYNFPNATTATFQGCPTLIFGLPPIPFQRLVLKDNLPKFHRMGSMPQLTSLELVDIRCVSNESMGRQDTVYQLSRYLLKSPLLTELKLTTVTIGHPEMFYLLEALPQLERLSVVEQIGADVKLISPRFIKKLDGPGVLLELEHLQLVWSGEVDEGAILDMLEKRALESVVIGVRKGGKLRPDTLARVDTLRKCGTEVRLW